MTGKESPTDPFRLGVTVETSAREISMADIEEFARLTGDRNPLHLDPAFASKQRFGGRVAHGLLTLSVTLGLWYRAGFFDGWVVVFSGIDALRFHRPVFPGDSLAARLTTRAREKTPRGETVELECATLNQRGETVLSFVARLLLAPPR